MLRGMHIKMFLLGMIVFQKKRNIIKFSCRQTVLNRSNQETSTHGYVLWWIHNVDNIHENDGIWLKCTWNIVVRNRRNRGEHTHSTLRLWVSGWVIWTHIFLRIQIWTKSTFPQELLAPFSHELTQTILTKSAHYHARYKFTKLKLSTNHHMWGLMMQFKSSNKPTKPHMGTLVDTLHFLVYRRLLAAWHCFA